MRHAKLRVMKFLSMADRDASKPGPKPGDPSKLRRNLNASVDPEKGRVLRRAAARLGYRHVGEMLDDLADWLSRLMLPNTV